MCRVDNREPGDTVRLDYRRDGQPLAANIDVPNVWRAGWRDGALRLGPSARRLAVWLLKYDH